jgi:hypothetical protein
VDRFLEWAGIFLFATTLRFTRPPIQLLRGGGAHSSGLRWPEREASRSPPTSANVKNVWSYTSISTNVVIIISSSSSVLLIGYQHVYVE